MGDSFYVRLDDDRYESTDHTIGPWSRESQHAGPPAALLGHAIETVDRGYESHVARITFEILKPVPIETLTVDARVVRPGRSVELVEASLRTDSGEVMLARAWRIRTTDLDLVRVDDDPPPLLPEDGSELPQLGDHNYLSAMEMVFTKGSFGKLGPATVWFRMRYPLVAGEEPSPLTRVLAAADSGNGISAEMDFSKWLFVNPDLSVYLHRMPEGEWVCLDARTVAQSNGIGLAASTIYDARGAIGRGLQSLFIAPR